jgi:hypothetical protein
LKNIFLFSKALAAKVGWRLISSSSLWSSVVEQKYIRLDTIEDWIRKPNKIHPNCSIIWKAVTKSFSVVGDDLAWRIGRGTKVWIGVDPWPGSGNSQILPNEIIENIHDNGIFFLNQISDGD